MYCEGCFSCGECGAALAGPGTATYTKHDKLYCHDHYMKIFVPVCARCGEYITQVSRASNEGLRRFHNHGEGTFANLRLKLYMWACKTEHRT